MPPFGIERDEPVRDKPLPYLSLQGIASKKPRKTKGSSGPFGVELAEEVGEVGGEWPKQAAVNLRPGPFQGEECEEPSYSTSSSQHHCPRPSTVAQRNPDCLFGDEPAEESGEEPESSSDDGVTDEAAYRGSLETVFSLGWHTLLDLKKASFWKDNMDTASEKKKRRYNNTNREALAKYARQQSVGAFSRNGVDPHRLQKLVGLPSCQCPLNGVTYTFVCFFNRTTCCRKELPVEVCGSPIGPYSGANNICFKQFANSKELPSFLKSFWGLPKQDQDSLAPSFGEI